MCHSLCFQNALRCGSPPHPPAGGEPPRGWGSERASAPASEAQGALPPTSASQGVPLLCLNPPGGQHLAARRSRPAPTATASRGLGLGPTRRSRRVPVTGFCFPRSEVLCTQTCRGGPGGQPRATPLFVPSTHPAAQRRGASAPPPDPAPLSPSLCPPGGSASSPFTAGTSRPTRTTPLGRAVAPRARPQRQRPWAACRSVGTRLCSHPTPGWPEPQVGGQAQKRHTLPGLESPERLSCWHGCVGCRAGSWGLGVFGGCSNAQTEGRASDSPGPPFLGNDGTMEGPSAGPRKGGGGCGAAAKGHRAPHSAPLAEQCTSPPNSFPPSFLGALVSGWGAKPLGCWKCFFLFVWQVALCSGTRPSPQGMGAEEAITAGFLKPKGLLCKGVERAGV